MTIHGFTAALEYRLRHAELFILDTYGHTVSIENKRKPLTKFGRNSDLGTSEETVWLVGGTETYATDNDIISISSSDDTDTQSVVIEGHTVSGGNLTFVSQTVTMTGQTEKALTTPLYRATRLYNAGATNFAGTVYVYESDTVTDGVPQTASKIHIRTDGTNNQSLKCATSLSSVDYWIITHVSASVLRQTAAAADLKLQVRESGGVFRTLYPFSVHTNSGVVQISFDPCLVVRPNSDIRLQATASTTSVQVEGAIHGYLASIS